MKSAFPGTAPSHSASSAKVMSLYATEGTYRRLSRSARCCASFSFGGGLYYEVERGGGPRGHEAVMMGKDGKDGMGKEWKSSGLDWIGRDGMGWDGMGWDRWVAGGEWVGMMRDVGEERGLARSYSMGSEWSAVSVHHCISTYLPPALRLDVQVRGQGGRPADQQCRAWALRHPAPHPAQHARLHQSTRRTRGASLRINSF